MVGTNKIVLNKETLIRALEAYIQDYFDTDLIVNDITQATDKPYEITLTVEVCPPSRAKKPDEK